MNKKLNIIMVFHKSSPGSTSFVWTWVSKLLIQSWRNRELVLTKAWPFQTCPTTANLFNISYYDFYKFLYCPWIIVLIRFLDNSAPEESAAAKKDFEKSFKKYQGVLKKQEQLLRGKYIILGVDERILQNQM